MILYDIFLIGRTNNAYKYSTCLMHFVKFFFQVSTIVFCIVSGFYLQIRVLAIISVLNIHIRQL